MRSITSVITILLVLIYSEAIHALDVEKLFMPGKLIAGHMKYETECKHCHVRLRDTTQKQLCMDCHKPIGVDVRKKTGFHGKNKKAISSDCKVCHTDHKGKDARIVWLDKDRFDHKPTDYPLLGKHLQTECADCHKKDKKFRDAPSACVSCHKDDDFHKNKLGDKCADCHNPKAWTSEQFDHDKTDFKLKHAHKQVACNLCHIDNRYKKTPKTCVACHAIRDVHENRFGNKCEDCHVEKKWDESIFKHDRDTKFRLKGTHRTVSCHSCHSASDKTKTKKKVQRTCFDCHRLDDVHKGNNGKKCQDCHTEKSWLESAFDHDEKTDFPLRGAHKKASCQACHQTNAYDKKTDTACYSCHKHEDAHKDQQGKQCETCHNESTWWLQDVRFDHELSNFPLIGQHAATGCESCHFTSAFKDAGSECNDCHQEDDVHKQALGENCAQCHNPNDWLIWRFDHDETDFKIKGAHDELHCDSCHFKPLDKNNKRVRRCIDCHNRNDIHNGNFGPDCDNCHTQDEFSSPNIRSMKSFKSKVSE